MGMTLMDVHTVRGVSTEPYRDMRTMRTRIYGEGHIDEVCDDYGRMCEVRLGACVYGCMNVWESSMCVCV